MPQIERDFTVIVQPPPLPNVTVSTDGEVSAIITNTVQNITVSTTSNNLQVQTAEAIVIHDDGLENRLLAMAVALA